LNEHDIDSLTAEERKEEEEEKEREQKVHRHSRVEGSFVAEGEYAKGKSGDLKRREE